MSDYRPEKRECDGAVQKAIELTPRINKELIRARDVSRSLSQRKESMKIALLLTRALMDDLLLRQVRLGWCDERDELVDPCHTRAAS